MFRAASLAHSRAARIAILLFLPVIAAGQASRTTGIIQGSVIDQTGGAIAGATIQLTNPATNQTRSGASDSTGSFLLTGVPVGVYQLKVESPGFAAYQNKTVEVSVGSITSVTVRLAPAAVQQQVTVSEEAPPIDVTQTTVASTVGPERIEESPVVTRNYLNFVLLVPSLTQSNNTRSAAVSSVFADSGFSFAGLRPRSTPGIGGGVQGL